MTAQLGPAMVVRLPGGAYWGFSMREPFGDCQLELVTDLKKLKTAYNFRADHPMVADPLQPHRLRFIAVWRGRAR